MQLKHECRQPFGKEICGNLKKRAKERYFFPEKKAIIKLLYRESNNLTKSMFSSIEYGRKDGFTVWN